MYYYNIFYIHEETADMIHIEKYDESDKSRTNIMIMIIDISTICKCAQENVNK